MAKQNRSEEVVYRSFDELQRRLLPSEVFPKDSGIIDSVAFGKELGRESLSVIEAALRPPKGEKEK